MGWLLVGGGLASTIFVAWPTDWLATLEAISTPALSPLHLVTQLRSRSRGSNNYLELFTTCARSPSLSLITPNLQ